MKLTTELETVYGLTPEHRLYQAELEYAKLLSHLAHNVQFAVDIDAVEEEVRSLSASMYSYDAVAQFLASKIPLSDEHFRIYLQGLGVQASQLPADLLPSKGNTKLRKVLLSELYARTGNEVFNHAYQYRSISLLLDTVLALRDLYYKKKELLSDQGVDADEVYLKEGYHVVQGSRRTTVKGRLLSRDYHFNLFKPLEDKYVVRVEMDSDTYYAICNLVDREGLASYLENDEYPLSMQIAALVYDKGLDEITREESRTLNRYLLGVSLETYRSADPDFATRYDGTSFDGVKLTKEAKAFLDGVIRYAEDRIKRVYRTPEGRLLEPEDTNYQKPAKSLFTLIGRIWADMQKIGLVKLHEAGYTPYFIRPFDVFYVIDRDEEALDRFKQEFKAAFSYAKPEGFSEPVFHFDVDTQLRREDLPSFYLSKRGAGKQEEGNTDDEE